MLTQEESEKELPPEGICDGKLGTCSLYYLCPGRDAQPDGGLNLGRHGASWRRFFSVDSPFGRFCITGHIPDFSETLGPSEHKSSGEAAGLGSSQSPGTGALARLNRTQHTPVSSCLYHPQTFQPGPSFQKWTCSPAPGKAPSSFNPLLSRSPFLLGLPERELEAP